MAERGRALEGVALDMFAGCYHGRRVLLTGHTGFKGSWLALWLVRLGAQVTGLALAPATAPNHWDLLHLDVAGIEADIRDPERVRRVVEQVQPEIVFHLAAQSLVRASYADPLQTWSTNVMGTANLLEACRHTGGVRAVVVVTSDKCYQNEETAVGHRETDRLGGHDPYSASKAAAELVAESYRRSFFGRSGAPRVATARAGNVIGGGDWSAERLVPDLARSYAMGAPLTVRAPHATRPWQHVLESLSGYLLLGERLLAGDDEAASAWNFGPQPQDECTVEQLLARCGQAWPRLAWRVSADPQPHETTLLHLDSSKARDLLGWQPVWQLQGTVAATAAWYHAFYRDGQLRSDSDLETYVAAAAAAGLSWAQA